MHGRLVSVVLVTLMLVGASLACAAPTPAAPLSDEDIDAIKTEVAATRTANAALVAAVPADLTATANAVLARDANGALTATANAARTSTAIAGLTATANAAQTETAQAALAEATMTSSATQPSSLGGEAPADVPVVAGEINVLEATAETVSYETNADYNEVVAFYRAEMVNHIWIIGETGTTETDNSTTLMCYKDYRTATVTISRDPNTQVTWVLVTIAT